MPVVLAMEWFARAARAARPTLRFVACEDIKVLKGISLSSFETGEGFKVLVDQVSNGDGAVLRLELRSLSGTRHYCAKARMAAPQVPLAILGRSSPLDSTESWQGPVYGDVLFHGPALQVIEDVTGVSDQGIAAQLLGTAGRGWREEPWHTDVAAMDGGLQLALLWAQRMLGGSSLPTAVGSYRGTGELPVGPIQAVLKGRVVGKSKTVSDIVFTTSDGRPIARLEGVETHLLPKSR